MFIDTCLLSVVLFTLWKWPAWKALPVLAVFFIVDIAYFGANLIKVPDGGWVPLAIGLTIFTLLTTWSRGRKLMQQEMADGAMPIPVFVKSAANSATRVPGTAVFMTSSSDGVPHALLHNLKHNKVLHARIILLTIKIADVPFVPEEKFCLLEDLGQGFHRLVLNYGFMQPINVPEALTRVTSCGGEFKMLETSFFLSRQTLIAASKPGMPIWREKLFAWMLRNSGKRDGIFPSADQSCGRTGEPSCHLTRRRKVNFATYPNKSLYIVAGVAMQGRTYKGRPAYGRRQQRCSDPARTAGALCPDCRRGDAGRWRRCAGNVAPAHGAAARARRW